MLTRTFFSLQRPWIPTAVAGSNLVVDIIFSFALYSPFGIGGVVAATVIATISSVIAEVVILRRQLVGLELTRLFATAARVLVGRGPARRGELPGLGRPGPGLGRGTIAQIISLGVALAAGFADLLRRRDRAAGPRGEADHAPGAPHLARGPAKADT